MSEPYYRRILADIRGRIAAGEWAPGERLPSTPELVTFYRVRINVPNLAAATVRHAVSLLIELGELRGQQGVGVFVSDDDVIPD